MTQLLVILLLSLSVVFDRKWKYCARAQKTQCL